MHTIDSNQNILKTF